MHIAALVFDRPWEGNGCGYVTVFKDGGRYRMWYRGSGYVYGMNEGSTSTHPQVVCYAESADGISWNRPSPGIVEFEGSMENNIVLEGLESHNFAPFKDENPDCEPDASYKALGGDREGLRAFIAGRHPLVLDE